MSPGENWTAEDWSALGDEVRAVCMVAIVRRLRGRADSARTAAVTFEKSGYPAESLRYHAKADAYALAIEDVEALMRDPATWSAKP